MLKVYQACIISTLFYGSERWNTYIRQGAKLNAFHTRCLRQLLSKTWMEKVTNYKVKPSHCPDDICHAESETTAMARSFYSNGEREIPKGPSLWEA